MSNISEFAQQIVDSITAAVILTDTRRIIIDASPAAQLLGYKPEELVGRSLSDVLQEKDIVASTYVKALNSPGEDAVTVPSLHAIKKDGTQFMVDVGFREIENADRHVFMVMITDTSNLHNANAALNEQKAQIQKALEEASRLRTQADQNRLAAEKAKRETEELNKKLEAQNATTAGELAEERKARQKQQELGVQTYALRILVILYVLMIFLPFISGFVELPTKVLDSLDHSTTIVSQMLVLAIGFLFGQQQMSNQQKNQMMGQQQQGYGMQQQGYMQQGYQQPMMQQPMAPPPQQRPPIQGRG